MNNEANGSLSPTDSLENYWTKTQVPVNGFVIISNPDDENNGKIFIKNFDGTNYNYSQIGNIGGVMPHITEDGLWSFDTNDASAVGSRAVAKEIELSIETDREINPLSFLIRNTDITDKEGNIIEVAPLYGLSNLTEKYTKTEEAGWQRDPNGQYVIIYKATKNGEFIYENLERIKYSEEDEYCLLDTEVWEIYQTTQPIFKTDWLKWRYT